VNEEIRQWMQDAEAVIGPSKGYFIPETKFSSAKPKPQLTGLKPRNRAARRAQARRERHASKGDKAMMKAWKATHAKKDE